MPIAEDVRSKDEDFRRFRSYSCPRDAWDEYSQHRTLVIDYPCLLEGDPIPDDASFSFDEKYPGRVFVQSKTFAVVDKGGLVPYYGFLWIEWKNRLESPPDPRPGFLSFCDPPKTP